MAAEILNAIPIVQAYTQERAESVRFGLAVENAFTTAVRRIRARSLLTVMAILLNLLFNHLGSGKEPPASVARGDQDNVVEPAH